MSQLSVTVTYLIQTTIEAKDEKDYQKKSDKLIQKMEKMGFCVNLENEDFGDDYESPDEKIENAIDQEETEEEDEDL